MVRNILYSVVVVFLLSSCSSLKPLQFTSNKPVGPASSNSPEVASTPVTKNNSIRFIDDIAVQPQAVYTEPVKEKKESGPKPSVSTRSINIEETRPVANLIAERASAIESASSLQLKYSVLLNTEVEQLQNGVLLESLDEWYGTKYRMGGMTKSGVDCSAFVQAVFATAFGLSLPRTAREQHRVTRRISRTELKEGDLVFFNTRGGVSHVGIYLQNNKFIHASTSRGVTISDLYEPYYIKRFIAAGRMEEQGYSSN